MFLGARHGSIGVPQDVFCALVRRGVKGDADAHRGEDLLIRDVERAGQLPLDGLGDLRGLEFLAEIIEQNGEFVSAQPRDRVVGANAGFEPFSDRYEQFIAHEMPKAVVDDFEAVDVKKQQGEQTVRMLVRMTSGHRQPLHKVGAVGQAGERVVHGGLH